ncbi:acyl-CoA dehydrogenase [Solimonas sp. K1W22B-7]|nr:acyl-CoA dehydrogenase [Solimonas sp. K1W22B-7]AXQ28133.1 acyl-CoA dehydrogenase [Solimonas sp. K1W22B-7]
MNLALTEDQILIRDAAENFLADVSTSAAVRAAMESAAGYDEAVWQRIGAELGWCALAIPEDCGGLGLGPVELALVMEQMGRRLLCAPFFSTVCLAANLLNETATEAARSRFLAAIAEGSLSATAPLPSVTDWAAAASELEAVPDGDGWKLNGYCARVPDGANVTWLFLLARLPDGDHGLFAVRNDDEGLAIQQLNGWDQTRRFARLDLSGVSADRIDDPARMAEGLPRAAALARLYIAAEQLGGAQTCLDLTVAYTATRKQFGRVIASFQAVKHRCAQMMVRVEELRSAVAGAAAVAAAGGDTHKLELETAMARALAADSFFWCAQEAIQLHGGVGFTWEYDPQLYFKRAQASSHWLGSADALREHLAAAVIAARTQADEAAASNHPDEAFRAEVAGWMREHLAGRFAPLKHRGGPGDEEAFPELRKDWERELAAGGWTCVGWPKEAGGRALSIQQQVIFHEEYARAGGPGRMGHIGEGLIGPALIRFGSAAQKARFLPEIVAGREYWAQGYSEPNAGSDLANVQTRCWQEADGSWRVQGQKIWTSLAQESEWIFVLARCEPGSKGNKGLAFLLMPLKQAGIEIRPIRQLGGGSEFNEVFFDGAVAQADHIVGAPGEGWKVAMGLLEAERGVSTLGQQMHFAHEVELVVAAAQAVGKAGDAQVRQRLALAWSGLRVMRYNALRMLAGEQTQLGREALIYKYYWSNWHRDLGKLAVDVLGPEADTISDDPAIRPLQQLFFFSRADTIYAGTNEIQLNLIAERGLQMPRELRPA